MLEITEANYKDVPSGQLRYFLMGYAKQHREHDELQTGSGIH